MSRAFVGDDGLSEMIVGSTTTAPVHLVAHADAGGLHAARKM